MQLFIDTANIDEIRIAASWGIITGVTTNPSLMAKEKCSDWNKIVKEICQLIDGPISVEAVGMQAEEMIKEARVISQISPNVVVKIPMGEEGIKAVKQLNKEGIRSNVTLIFSANQALLAALAGATYVSPFIGRLDDAGQDGIPLIAEIKSIYDNYGYQTQIITASVRHPLHVTLAAKFGSDIATVPFKVLKLMFVHPLTELGIKNFLDDWGKLIR